MPDRQWDYQLDVNLRAVFTGARAATRVIDDGGSIINISSTAALKASPNNGPYAVAKAGVDSPTLVADYGKKWLAEYTTKRYHQVSDEYSPDWDVSGTLQDLQLYYDVGLAVANSSRWPNWRADSEFRAIRDQSRK